MPNMDQLWGIIRTILTAVISYAVAKGWIPTGVVPAELVASIMTIAVAIWSMLGKTQAATVAKAAAIVNISDSEQRSAGVANPVSPTV